MAAAVTALALLATSPPSLGPLLDRPAGRPDPEVALPEPDTVVSADDTGSAARATPRLWCRPSDCVAWRTLLQTGPGEVAATGSLVVALPRGERRLVALDAATGDRRWEAPLPRKAELERQAELMGFDVEPGRGVRIFPAEDGVYLTGSGWLAHVDADGLQRWSEPVPRNTWWARQSGEVALFFGVASAAGPEVGPHEHLAAHDAATGELRWERHVWGMPHLLEDAGGVVLGTGEGRLGRIDAVTGDIVWELEVLQGWTPALGRWILAALPDGTRVLVDPVTGEYREAPFSDGEVYGVRSTGELHVVMVVAWTEEDAEGRSREGSRIEVTALDDEARVRWQHRSTFRHSPGHCCPALLVDPDEVTLRGVEVGVVLDARTGERVRVSQLDDAPEEPTITFVRDGVRATYGSDGAEIETSRGTVNVYGDPDVRLVATDPLVVAGEHELVGLDATG